jgi:Na+-transporting methylmalonyl-CoA/oxaloacetate decarboxylase gamma subunit
VKKDYIPAPVHLISPKFEELYKAFLEDEKKGRVIIKAIPKQAQRYENGLAAKRFLMAGGMALMPFILVFAMNRVGNAASETLAHNSDVRQQQAHNAEATMFANVTAIVAARQATYEPSKGGAGPTATFTPIRVTGSKGGYTEKDIQNVFGGIYTPPPRPTYEPTRTPKPTRTPTTKK